MPVITPWGLMSPGRDSVLSRGPGIQQPMADSPNVLCIVCAVYKHLGDGVGEGEIRRKKATWVGNTGPQGFWLCKSINWLCLLRNSTPCEIGLDGTLIDTGLDQRFGVRQIRDLHINRF